MRKGGQERGYIKCRVLIRKELGGRGGRGRTKIANIPLIIMSMTE